MARGSDAARSLRPSRICEMAGVLRQTRDKWVDRDLLAARAECGELELIELVALKTIYLSIRKGHVPIAWAQIRPKLRETIPASGLTVVWDVQTREAVFASDASEVVALAAHGRAVQVLDLATPIALARRAFRNEVDATRGKPQAKSRSAKAGLSRQRH